MRLGATLAHMRPAPPVDLAEWARRLVGEGFESLWVPQILGRGFFVADPFVALAVAATATDGVELGTATLQVPLHHPAELAHRIRSLQAVCGDRLSVGLSPGSTAADYALLDREYADRFAAFDRNVDRLRRLLAPATGRPESEAAADGAGSTRDPREGRPDRPALDPAPGVSGPPPFLLGSWGARVGLAAHEFDGWLASGYRSRADEIVAAHERYRAAGGRRALVCAIPLRRRADLGPVGEDLRRYADAGFDDAIVLVEPDGPSLGSVRALVP